MTVATLLTDVRYQISDELKTGYTDPELLTYLNQVNKYVFATLMDNASDLAMKKTTLTLTDGEVALPSDFELEDAIKNTDDVALNAVSPSTTPNSTQYCLMNDTLYSDNDSITLFYYYMPDDYDLTDTLAIPRTFENLYSEMLKFLIFNTDEYDTSIEQALMSRFESIIVSLATKRGSTNIKAVMPFRV